VKKLTLAAALGMGMLCAALFLQNRPVDWTQRLTDEMLHAPMNHWPRPSLAPDGGSGHFGAVLETEWSALGTVDQRWQNLPHDAVIECVRTASGASNEPFSRPCHDWFEAARRRLPVIERATLTAEAGPPDRFDALRGDDLDHLQELLVVGRIPAFEAVMREAEATSPEGHAHALDACVTALAVVRDLEWGNGLRGYGYAQRIAGLTFYWCAKAARGVGPERREQFRQQLKAINDGRPPLVHGFNLERTFQFLTMFGGTLPEKTVARADPRLKARLEGERGAYRDAELRKNWPIVSRFEDAMVAAAQLPLEKRDAAFRAPPSLLELENYKLDTRGYESYRSIDAVFEALSLLSAPVETTAISDQVTVTRDGDALRVKLKLRESAMTYGDGGVFTLPNEWTFGDPQ